MESQNLKCSRTDVYKAIDSERDYQEKLVRNDVTNQQPLEQLALIEHIIGQLKADWYNKPGLVNMAYFRKIAGICVRAMEQHGAVPRT
jgi:hypothetical protein